MKTALQFSIFIFLIVGFLHFGTAQNQAQQTQYTLQRTKETIVLDGELNENIWENS